MGSYNWGELYDATGDINQGSFLLVPPGVYGATVFSTEVKMSSTGKEMISTRFKITDPGPYLDQSVFTQFVLSPDSNDAMRIFFRHMAALGLPKSYFQTPGLQTGQVAYDLMNKPCRVKIIVQQYQGEDKSKVRDVLPPTNGSAGATIPGNTPGSMPQPAQMPTTPPVPAMVMPTPVPPQPQYAQPQYSQPQYSQPQYSQPQYSQPIPQPAQPAAPAAPAPVAPAPDVPTPPPLPF